MQIAINEKAHLAPAAHAFLCFYSYKQFRSVDWKKNIYYLFIHV